MMLTENIVKIAERIEQLQRRVDERRDVWSQTTKDRIHEHLEDVCKETHLGLRVTENDLCKNYSSVQLIFGILPSGIVQYTQGGGGHAFTKHGGYLNFAQTICGKIVVAVVYPFVEKFDVKKEPTTLLIGRHEPEEMSEDLVMACVVRFMEEIEKWEENWSPPNTPT